MKLLVLSSWYPAPPTNGAKLRAWHLLRELAQRHEITLLTFAEPGEITPEGASALAAICRRVETVAGNPHKPTAPLSWRGYFGPMPRSYAQTFNPTMAARAATVSHDVDAVVALEIGTAVYLEGCTGAPGIFEEAEISTIHAAVMLASGGLDRWRRGLAWRKYAAFTRTLVGSTAHTTVVSEQERDWMARAGCDVSRVSVVPNGVAAEYLQMDRAKRPDTIIYSGAVTYAPNLDAATFLASEILPRIRERRPTVSATVTGDCGDVAIDHLVARGVTFAGFVPDIAATVAETAVCVVPLRSGGGTRLKILEAMALGTPVVSTRKGAEGLDVTHGEHLLLADDPADFARCVVELLEEPGRATTLAANARALIAERYTWTRIGRLLDRVIEDAVAQGTGRRRSA